MQQTESTGGILTGTVCCTTYPPYLCGAADTCCEASNSEILLVEMLFPGTIVTTTLPVHGRGSSITPKRFGFVGVSAALPTH